MSETKRWKCEVCGYIHTGDEPPDSCPVCGADKAAFSLFEAAVKKEENQELAVSFICSVCGYESDGAPAECPVCGAGKNLFTAKKDESKKSDESEARKVVIAGGGIAGFTAAEEARKASSNSSIMLISKEKALPYFRLNLTRFLAGEVKESDLPLKDENWYKENKIELVNGNVKSINCKNKTVKLESGAEYPYDKLILANGSHPFKPPIPGINKKNIFSFRTIEDAKNILSISKNCKKCVCIGGGLLGLETSGAMKKQGLDVTVLEGYGWLLPRQLPETAGLKLKKYTEGFGIKVKSPVKIKEIIGDENVKGVLLEDGSTIDADIVIVSTGIRPNSYLARQSELKVNQGIVVDDYMTTSDKDVFAAGDVAEHSGKLYGIWPASYAQGLVAGLNAVGVKTEFNVIPPSTRLKVLDIDVFSIGQIDCNDASYQICEEDMDDSYRYFVCRDGKVVGAVLYGDTTLAPLLKDAVEKRIQLENLPELLEKVPKLKKVL